MISENQKKILEKFFQESCLKIISQGRKSCICPGQLTSKCRYRTVSEDGVVLKCIIGHMLTSKQINEFAIKEGDSIRHFPDKLINELLPDVSDILARDFLQSLQRLHDTANDDEFVNSFIISANNYADKIGISKLPEILVQNGT